MIKIYQDMNKERIVGFLNNPLLPNRYNCTYVLFLVSMVQLL